MPEVATKHREICVIARDIVKDWKDVNFGARPYLGAMLTLSTIHEDYYEDSAESVVAYFLSNATSWTGETARRVKAELNTMLKEIR